MLIGIHDKSQIVYLVDLGLSKRFIDEETKEHIPWRANLQLTGTASYASIHSHHHEEISRRDDLESVAMILIHFLEGRLPWQLKEFKDKKDKHKLVR